MHVQLKRRANRKHTRPRRHKFTSLDHLKPAPKPDPIALLKDVPSKPRDVSERKRGLPERKRGLPESFVRHAMADYLIEDATILDVARLMCDRYPGRWANAESCASSLYQVFRDREVLLDGDRRVLNRNPQLRAKEKELIRRYLETPDPGFAYRGPLDPAMIWEAAWLYYYEGIGFQRIGRRLRHRFPWCLRGSDKALNRRLHYIFRANGWPTRPQKEATAAANWRHGYAVRDSPALKDNNYRRYKKRREKGGIRPRCDAISQLTGRRCANFAMAHESKCYAHSKRTAEQRNEIGQRARAMRARDMMDSRPVVLWLKDRLAQCDSQAQLARLVGLDDTVLGKILKTGGTSAPGRLTQRLIERMLEHAMEHDGPELVPRFSELYDVVPERKADDRQNHPTDDE